MLETKKLQKRGIEYLSLDFSNSRYNSVCFDGMPFQEWFDDQCITYRFSWDFSATITGRDEQDSAVADIGIVCGTWINCCRELQQEFPFLIFCDIISQELYEFAEAITDKRGYIRNSVLGVPCKILYLDQLYLEPEYRGLGIGSYVFENFQGLFHFAHNFDYDVVCLTPIPQERNEGGVISKLEAVDYDERRRALVRFYQKAGARFINGSEFMLKKTTGTRHIV